MDDTLKRLDRRTWMHNIALILLGFIATYNFVGRHRNENRIEALNERVDKVERVVPKEAAGAVGFIDVVNLEPDPTIVPTEEEEPAKSSVKVILR